MNNNKNHTSEYWQDGIDVKKITLKFLSKWWMIVLGTLVGCLLGILIYFAYHAIADGVVYQGYSEFKLDFVADETGEAFQKYNGYTWNDMMTTSIVADGTLKRVEGDGIDLQTLEEVTLAEIKSDLRILKVTFTDSDLVKCQKIQTATEESLVELGQTAEEFSQITVIKSISPVRVYADNRLPQAILLGAILGCVISLIALWFMEILDDRIMVQSDLYGLTLPFLGIELCDEESELSKRLALMVKNNIEHLPDAQRMDVSEISESIDDSKSYIIEIPYRKITKREFAIVLNNLEVQAIEVAGVVITKADGRFYRFYL